MSTSFKQAWLRVFLLISITAFLFNFAWEYAQCFLFVHLAAPATFKGMLFASLGDVVLTWIAITVVALCVRRVLWFLNAWSWNRLFLITLVNFVLATVIELNGLHAGRWTYSVSNPVLPVLGVSLIPVLQLCILVPLSLFVVKVCQRRLGNRRSVRVHSLV